MASGAEDADFAGAVIAEHRVFDDRVVGDLDVAIFPGDSDDFDHRTAQDADLPAMGDGHFDDLLDTVDVRREGADDDAAWGFVEDFLDAASDIGFGRGIAFQFGIGAVGKQQINAFGADSRKALEVEFGADWGQIDFEIAGIDDASLLGVDADAIAIGDRMGDAEEADDEIIGEYEEEVEEDDE